MGMCWQITWPPRWGYRGGLTALRPPALDGRILSRAPRLPLPLRSRALFAGACGCCYHRWKTAAHQHGERRNSVTGVTKMKASGKKIYRNGMTTKAAASCKQHQVSMVAQAGIRHHQAAGNSARAHITASRAYLATSSRCVLAHRARSKHHRLRARAHPRLRFCYISSRGNARALRASARVSCARICAEHHRTARAASISNARIKRGAQRSINDAAASRMRAAAPRVGWRIIGRYFCSFRRAMWHGISRLVRMKQKEVW